MLNFTLTSVFLCCLCHAVRRSLAMKGYELDVSFLPWSNDCNERVGTLCCCHPTCNNRAHTTSSAAYQQIATSVLLPLFCCFRSDADWDRYFICSIELYTLFNMFFDCFAAYLLTLVVAIGVSMRQQSPVWSYKIILLSVTLIKMQALYSIIDFFSLVLGETEFNCPPARHTVYCFPMHSPTRTLCHTHLSSPSSVPPALVYESNSVCIP